ncbi:MAG: hypothetical protein F4190_02400, partial [Acidimicrobiales bacterium]|nr:hypothetical protein [Acidimicrobiales bacterium]MYI27915.1 hypothetical protein [Acidimicrobiales bacterium]
MTSGDVFDESPSWSPDGSRIAFSRETGREVLEAVRLVVADCGSDGRSGG